MASGDMVVLTDSIGDINTADALNLFEGYGKVFIVNGTNLKVADFKNTKIATADIGSNPPDFGTILTGGTSGAAMVVDYITAVSSACTVYGFRTTSATFSSGETVTGTDDDGNAISFVTSAAETAPPHWYSWTVWPDNASGSLPTSAYLGCLYRGRCVLSGNTTYPFQWYMSRQANPWDFAYVALDAQSPVAGGNADAGETGDIIRALIPYQDEFLLFGCANSWWVMRGDPAAGGELAEVDLTVGMFGPQSYCWDNNGNLYFMSKDSLCTIPNGFGRIQNISGVILPNLAQDATIDPDVHRITLGYDRDRQGIMICITTLADGSNTNYWYDLRTNGFFPETYANNLGCYSQFYYESNDDDYRRLVLGCTDGYIRTHDTSSKDDVDGDDSTLTITSEVVLPVIDAEDDDSELLLTSLTVSVSGGASGGSASDSDGVSVNIFDADEAETVIENIDDGDSPQSTTTLSATGRSNRIRDFVRGHSLAIQLKNSTATQTWSVNKVAGDISPVGKVQ